MRIGLWFCTLTLLACRQVGGIHDDLSDQPQTTAGSSSGASAGTAGTSGGGAGTGAIGGTSGTAGMGGAGNAGTAGAAGAGGSIIAGSAGTGANGGSVSFECPSGKGPDMAKLVLSYLGDPSPILCVDKTEVTSAQWQIFANQNSEPNIISQMKENLPTACAQADLLNSIQDGADDWPVRGVSWCGAQAFCHWAGKRLCGAMGVGLVSRETHNPWDASADEWTYACSDGPELRNYPYGETYQSGVCADNGDVFTHPAGNSDVPGCITEAGVKNLAGSIWEWTSICDNADDPTGCVWRGGFYGTSSDQDEVSCRGVRGADYPGGDFHGYCEPIGDNGSDVVGFRCCQYSQ